MEVLGGSKVPDVPAPPATVATPAVARVSVNLPLKVWEALEEIAKQDQISRTEALRRAISTEVYMWKARRSGAQILVEQPDKSVERVVFPY
jgi:metal-responsive CopG/Arc/MetJ family transcriptional regulator